MENTENSTTNALENISKERIVVDAYGTIYIQYTFGWKALDSPHYWPNLTELVYHQGPIYWMCQGLRLTKQEVLEIDNES